MTLNESENLIILWAHNKGILPDGQPLAQLEKTEEEVAELREAIETKNLAEVKDALGDIFVTLTIQAKLWDLGMEECVEHAYNIIKKRTGKMVNGKFVKDS